MFSTHSLPTRVTQLTTPSLLAFLLCATIAGCSDTTVATKSFEESETFTVPGAPISLGVQTLDGIAIPVNLAEQSDYQDGDFDYVTSVKVRGITFDISPTSSDPAVEDGFGEDGNLDTFEFVQSLSLSLRAVVDGTMQTVAIADLPMDDPQIASNATSLTMNTNGDENIRDLIEADGGAEILVSITGTLPPDFVVVDANILFRVGVGFR